MVKILRNFEDKDERQYQICKICIDERSLWSLHRSGIGRAWEECMYCRQYLYYELQVVDVVMLVLLFMLLKKRR